MSTAYAALRLSALTIVAAIAGFTAPGLVLAKGGRPVPVPAPPTPPPPEAVKVPDLIETLATSTAPTFATLVGALRLAGLTPTLKEPGPFTVFAPSDAAFQAMDAKQWADLQAPANRAALRSFLLHHVARQQLTAAAISRLRGVAAADGRAIAVEVGRDRQVRLDGVGIVRSDLAASNGLVHVLRAVLAPVGSEPLPATAAPRGSDPTAPSKGRWYRDLDQDGYGNPAASVLAATKPAGYVANKLDCDDSKPGVNPGATEIPGNGIDDNCDGQVDEQATPRPWYRDQDHDHYGNPAVVSPLSNAQPPGYVADSTDCDDANPNVHPGAAEVPGNGIDDNCNGQTDEVAPVVAWYRDQDGDGYGDPAVSVVAAARPPGYVVDHTDCNDTKAAVHPGAAEVPGNGLDDNCNGQIDETPALHPYFRDQDGDGFGDPNVGVQAVSPPQGYVADHTDCDDTRASVFPGAPEIPGNGLDDNCNGQVDEVQRWYRDLDQDGYGNPAASVLAATKPAGYVANKLDCDDSKPGVNPGATEIPGNGIDDNCDGVVDSH